MIEIFIHEHIHGEEIFPYRSFYQNQKKETRLPPKQRFSLHPCLALKLGHGICWAEWCISFVGGTTSRSEATPPAVRSRLWTWLSIECRLRRRLLVRRRQSIRFQSPRPPRLRQHLAAARHPTTSDEVALAFPSDPNITACVCIPFVFVLAGGSRRMRALVLDLFCYCANWSLPQGCGHLPEFQLILTHIRFYQG